MTDDINKLLDNYKPTKAAQDLISQNKVVLLVGISGAGKSTIRHRLLNLDSYYHIISHTTRPPRSNNGILEKDGREYHFIDLDQAKNMLKNHDFIEAKRYGKNIYGTSTGEFLIARNEHKIAITDIEVQGVAEYMDFASESTYPIFLLPPSYETWRERWQKRYETSEERGELEERTQTAISELEHVLKTNYFYIVVNDDLEKAVQLVNTITETGYQAKDEHQAGLNTAKQILAAMKQQISTR